METIKLNANPEWLIWAGKTSKYTIETIASKIRKSPKTITNWEKTGKLNTIAWRS